MNNETLYSILVLAALAGTENANSNDSNTAVKAEVKKLKAEYVLKFRELKELGDMIKRLEKIAENDRNN